MSKIAGYIVMESCEDYEQGLILLEAESLPAGGVLDWGDRNFPRAMFASKQDARAAIERTEHYRLAFGLNRPEKKFCRVVPVRAIAAAVVDAKP